MIHFVMGVLYPVFRSASFLPALISHELRAPCVTCERVPDFVRRYVAPSASNFPWIGPVSTHIYPETELSRLVKIEPSWPILAH
jgi:hypothetical protein